MPFASLLRVGGSQAEIGHALARAAIGAYGSTPRRVDPALGAARNDWLAAHWPEHRERCRGMAAAFGVPDDDPSMCVDDLNGVPLPVGCSAVWWPPATIVRNFDVPVSVLGALSRPHRIEMRPEGGLSSVALTGNNLSGCLEGVNEAGLAVVALADGQISEGSSLPRAGFNEAELPRFLLDRCRTAAQARTMLREAEHYVRHDSCHFLIADATGDAFVWERPGDIVEAGSSPLVVTNHLLSQASPPGGDSHARYRALRQRLDGTGHDLGDVRAALDSVRAGGDRATLWRTEYDLEKSSMSAQFLEGR